MMITPSSEKLVTILVPNYKTLEITKICMRLIRKFTDLNVVDVIVIDNNSNDASLDYLKTLKWITLLERKATEAETPAASHSNALDFALDKVKTPYVLSIHTDTFVKDKAWIQFLLAPFADNKNLAGVGSWKLESKSQWRIWGVEFEQYCKYLLHRFFNYKHYNKDRLDMNAHYLRSHCAMYKTDVIRALKTRFGDGGATAGKVMHSKMLAANYDMLFIESAKLGKYIDHLNHATLVLNPDLGSKSSSIREGKKRIKKKLRGIDASAILDDISLDS
jgi:hypothetical protein